MQAPARLGIRQRETGYLPGYSLDRRALARIQAKAAAPTANPPPSTSVTHPGTSPTAHTITAKTLTTPISAAQASKAATAHETTSRESGPVESSFIASTYGSLRIRYPYPKDSRQSEKVVLSLPFAGPN